MSARCRRFAVALFVLGLLGVSVSACGDSSPSPSPSPSLSQGVRGTTTISAKDGVHPQPGVTVAVHAGDLDAPVVASGKTDEAGAFSFDLVPGTYTLIWVTDAARPETVIVEPGRYAEVTLTIASK